MRELRFLGLCLLVVVAACGGGEEDSRTETPVTTQADQAVTTTEASREVTEFAAGVLGAVEVSVGEEIQIRSLNAITGDVAFLGLPNQRGAELAIADYGPVAGRGVSLGTGLDDLCSPEGGQASAQTIVADPSVVGVIGDVVFGCGGGGVAVDLQRRDGDDFAVEYVSGVDVGFGGYGGSAYQPGYFRTAHNDLFQGRAVALFVRNELGLNTAAAIHDGDPYTQGLAQAFMDAFEELGGVVTTFTAVNKGDTDMTAVLTEVAAGRPQAVFFPIFMPEGGFIVQQVGGVSGLEGVMLVVADGLLTDNFMELPESEGVYMSGPDLRYGSNTNSITGKGADDFLAAYQAAYGEAPSASFWAHAYDATAMLLRAIDLVAVESEGTLYIDRQQLRDELYRSNFDGIIGPITCDEFGDCGSQLITVVHHTDSRNIEAGKSNVVFSYTP